MKLTGKTIVLTGASGGLGQALAHTLARHNNRLILVARDGARLYTLKQSLDHSEAHSMCKADIATAEGRQQLVQHCSAYASGVDVLINNAGLSHFGFLAEHDDASLMAIMHTNLLAPILLSKALLPLLNQAPAGLIANIGSSFGSIGYPGFSGYCASKFGLRGFSEALRRELADTSIKVSYLAPRATHTAINSAQVVAMNAELGNAMDAPEVVAHWIVQTLTTKPGQDAFFGWPEKFFIRMNSLLPRVVDKALRKQLATIHQYAMQ